MTYINSEDVAYFAGLFDGDGSVGVYNRSDKSGYISSVIITNTKREPLDELTSIFGGYVSVRKQDYKKYKFLYNWHVYGKDQIRFLMAILPFLRIKRQQVELFLEYKVMYARGKKYSNPTHEKICEIMVEMKKLKKGDQN